MIEAKFPTPPARERCEAFLREQIAANNAASILPSENRVAERLLGRGEELAHVYEEVIAQLDRDGIGWKVFLGCLLTAGAFWSPEHIAKYRADRAALLNVNRDIAEQAKALAASLEYRDKLHNHSGFHSGTQYDVVTVIEVASVRNGLFATYLKDPLSALRTQFDTKYWPTIAACVRVLADDAEAAKVEATDPMTEASTRSSRASKADSARALREAIDEARGSWLGSLPRRFHASDESMATIVNVLLDLPPRQMVDAAYIKNLRHRDQIRLETDRVDDQGPGRQLRR